MLLVPISHIAVAQPNEASPSFALLYQAGTQQVMSSPDLTAEQAWFAAPEWQIGETEASADIQSGRVTYYDNEDDFLASF